MARYDGRANLLCNQPGGLTEEKAREIGRAGGIASGKARRQRRMMRETISALLQSRLDDADMAAALEAAGLPADLQGGINLAIMRKALLGDVEAARYLRDTAGEKPTETFNLGVSDKPIRALDLTQMSDADLERLADGDDGQEALPPGAVSAALPATDD